MLEGAAVLLIAEQAPSSVCWWEDGGKKGIIMLDGNQRNRMHRCIEKEAKTHIKNECRNWVCLL